MANFKGLFIYAEQREVGVSVSASGQTLIAVPKFSGATFEWKYKQLLMAPYQSFAPAQTNDTFTCNFTSVGHYRVICEVTSSTGTVNTSNEISIIADDISGTMTYDITVDPTTPSAIIEPTPMADQPSLYIKLLDSDLVMPTLTNPYNPSLPDYTIVTDLQGIMNYAANLTQLDFKQDRDCILAQVMLLGDGSEAAGFDLLTPQQQYKAASLNIGTPAQILAAIPNSEERKEFSEVYNIALRNVRRSRLTHITGDVFSACKAILIEVEAVPSFFLNMPTVIRMFLRIADINPEFQYVEERGDMRFSFEFDGIMELAEDGITGILDFFLESVGTRFQPYDAINNKYGGCKTHPFFASTVPDGFANVSEFADYIAQELKWGSLEHQN